MTIEFHCHVCNKLLRTADDKVGRTAKCPGCGERITVPHAGGPAAAEDEFGGDEFGDFGADEFGGGEQYEDYDEFGGAPATARRGAGRMMACPMCGEQVRATATRCSYCGESLGKPRKRRRSSWAADRVRPPAIALIVFAAVCTVLILIGIVINVAQLAAGAQPAPGQVPLFLRPEFNLIQCVIGLISSAVVVFGAVKMLRVESYALAMTATIVSMLPCISPCCILGLPLGIWSLVILNDEQVKNGFPH